MIQVSNVKMPLDWGIGNDTVELARKVSSMLGAEVSPGDVKLLRRGVDARKRSNVHFVATVLVSLDPGIEETVLDRCTDAKRLKGDPDIVGKSQIAVVGTGEQDERQIDQKQKMKSAGCVISDTSARPIVVGSGPAGLFCALVLARRGTNPIVLERGGNVTERARAIDAFAKTGVLDPECNVQFGEGGAGTYSDGKLATGLSDKLVRTVLEEFAAHGAPEEILWQAKPHIGTDLLPGVVKSIRAEIENLGGTFEFNARFSGFKLANGRLSSVEAVRTGNGWTYAGDQMEFPASALVLAIGHSARDTLEMLHEAGLPMMQKPFSMGVRIEHPQSWLDEVRYGRAAAHPALGPADYKLSCHLNSGRSVYTFCMCPGGEVVAASSEPGMLAVNGMSRFARDGRNSNAALLVDVKPADFGSNHPLAGMSLQRSYERMAFELGGSSYAAPVQLVGDFLQRRASEAPESVLPSYPIGVTWTELDRCLPDYVSAALREALPILAKKIRGFDMPDAVMTGIESRSSSPVRILRDKDTRQCRISNIDTGVYPCGEGAGYAGGITSSAVDGIRTAFAVLDFLYANGA